MKLGDYSEFWYAIALGVATGLLGLPAVAFGWQALHDHSHSAPFAWGYGLVALVLVLLAVGCLGLELLLLKTRQLIQDASSIGALVVFVIGLGALLVAISLSVDLWPSL